MIEIHLDQYLKKHQMTLTQLSEAVDITIANLSILKSGKAKAIRFSTLEKICEVLECQPGDLISYVPED
ncbi:helix-turn-helix domain-containing protein [Enterococcus cecorum]|uniref:helix-turn-helix domain-containing protein n=1 Tax=Enterococcus cecorum TaxID=44008 RepID=UPI0038B26B62